MSVKGLVLDERAYLGSVTPPDTFEDKSRFKNDGVHTDITWVKNPQGIWVRSFNATSSLITVPDHASIRNIWGGDGGTIMAWINPASDGEGSAGIITAKIKSDGTTPGWNFYLVLEAGGFIKLRLYTYWDGADGSWITTNASVPINTFSCVALTYNNGATTNDPIFYLNGVVEANTETITPTGTVEPDTAAQPLTIGNRVDTTKTFDGTIARVKMQRGILEAEQVAARYQATKHWFGR